MGLLAGAMTARRFRVSGEMPEGWRDHLRDGLENYAFPEHPGKGKEEVEGWVRVQNLLDREFDDFNLWLYNNYAVFALRVDKRTLPARLFKATLEKQCEQWCEAEGVERVPNTVKLEIKERLEAEWLDRVLPRCQVTEIIWNLDENWVLLGSTSDKLADRVRKRFLQSFGVKLVPWSPLDLIQDDAMREALLASGGEA